MEACPQCGAELIFDYVDDYGLGSNPIPRCEACMWRPGAVRVPCECGCGKLSYCSAMEFNHPDDYKYDERA